MHEVLFDHIDILPENVHIPDGTIAKDEIFDYCREYEQKIEQSGGLDVQLLGIGRTGHIGFNEPGSLRKTRTRLITLDDMTRSDAAPTFYGEEIGRASCREVVKIARGDGIRDGHVTGVQTCALPI